MKKIRVRTDPFGRSRTIESKEVEEKEEAAPPTPSHDKIAETVDRKFGLGEKSKIETLLDKKPDINVQSDQLDKAKEAIEKKEKEGDFKKVEVIEAKQIIRWERVAMYLSVFGIVAIIMIAQSSYIFNPAVMILLMFFGMSCFLPLGLVLGWLFLSIDTRVKIMRRMRGKNYGIVHFVLKGGQRMITRILDLNGDIVVHLGRMWVLDEHGIHYINRDRQKIFWADITSDHIKTLPANIPCLYLDYETMIPLKFYKEQSQSNPLQVGANHLGYISNQIAKNLFFKKAMQLFYIIIIALLAVCLVISVQAAMWLNDMKDQVPAMQEKIDRLAEIINDNLLPVDIVPSIIDEGGGGSVP